MPMCVSVWGEGESQSASSIFLWLCHSQSGFACYSSGPIVALGSFSPCLICHMEGRHFLAKMQVPFFSSLGVVMPK